MAAIETVGEENIEGRGRNGEGARGREEGGEKGREAGKRSEERELWCDKISKFFSIYTLN